MEDVDDLVVGVEVLRRALGRDEDDTLLEGRADGVLICGCHIGDCHYQDGNKIAEKRAEAIKLLLEDYGLEEERFRLEWISASEGNKFAKIAYEMTETLKELGPNPYIS